MSKPEITCYRYQQKGHYANKFACNLFKHNTYRSRPKGPNFVRGNDSRPQTHFSITFHIFIVETSLNFKSYNSDCSWIFDTAATNHFCKDRSLIWNYESLKKMNQWQLWRESVSQLKVGETLK